MGCPWLQSDMPLHPNSSAAWAWLDVCKVMNTAQYDIRKDDIVRLGGGGMLTEFGAVADSAQARDLLIFTMDQADANLVGWSYWLITPSTDPAHPNWEPPLLSRTAPFATPGVPTTVAFNTTSGHFTMTFAVSTDPVVARQSLVVYASAQYHY